MGSNPACPTKTPQGNQLIRKTPRRLRRGFSIRLRARCVIRRPYLPPTPADNRCAVRLRKPTLAFCDALDDDQVIEFTEDGETRAVGMKAAFKDFLSKLPKVVEFRETAPDDGPSRAATRADVPHSADAATRRSLRPGGRRPHNGRLRFVRPVAFAHMGGKVAVSLTVPVVDLVHYGLRDTVVRYNAEGSGGLVCSDRGPRF